METSRADRASSRAHERGLTLIELMVVLVFIAFGVLALSVVQTHSFTDVHSTGRHTRALELAQMRMEVARGAGFDLAVTDSGAVGRFAWRSNVDSVAVGLRRVTTTVSWVERGAPRSVRVMSLISAR